MVLHVVGRGEEGKWGEVTKWGEKGACTELLEILWSLGGVFRGRE